MKASELIEKLQEIVEKEGDLDVWIDSANEYQFGDVSDVVGKMFTERPSNDNPHIYIISSIELQRYDE